MIYTPTRLALALAAVLFATPLFAQNDDAALNIAEPDFTLVNLPTSLRLPSMKSAFRITHRFVRPLKCDECEDNLLEDLFGIDNGAAIGIEFRFGVVPGGQVVFHRARIDKTIQLLGEYSLSRQSSSMPLEMAAVVAIEGTDNFRDDYSGTFGVVLTRLLGDRASVHLEPIFVANSNLLDNGDDDSTFMLGIGSRIRLRPTVYVVGEITPRISGYKPDTMLGSFAIEKRAGGHVFQLNFSNYFGTTMRQLAQGAPDGDHWYMGFNISRKFF